MHDYNLLPTPTLLKKEVFDDGIRTKHSGQFFVHLTIWTIRRKQLSFLVSNAGESLGGQPPFSNLLHEGDHSVSVRAGLSVIWEGKYSYDTAINLPYIHQLLPGPRILSWQGASGELEESGSIVW